MNTKKIFLAVAFVAAFLFVSCSPNSTADDDALYDKSGVEKSRKFKVPTNG
ncbi:peptidase m28 [Flavobacteriaceae bacterium R38]|nr:peptidase m28 [Flavobacteriaceae bacterium R38]